MNQIKNVFVSLTVVLLLCLKMPFAIWCEIIDWLIKQVKSI